PIGGVFAAFGGPDAEEKWFSNIHDEASESVIGHFETGISNVRERGYAIGIGHSEGEAIELSAHDAFTTKAPDERENLVRVVNDAAPTFNIGDVKEDQDYEFHSATAPVFDKNGVCVFSLTVWGPDGLSSGADVQATIKRLTRTAEAATQELQFSGA